jgi:hypothetical protein
MAYCDVTSDNTQFLKVPDKNVQFYNIVKYITNVTNFNLLYYTANNQIFSIFHIIVAIHTNLTKKFGWVYLYVLNNTCKRYKM